MKFKFGWTARNLYCTVALFAALMLTLTNLLFKRTL